MKHLPHAPFARRRRCPDRRARPARCVRPRMRRDGRRLDEIARDAAQQFAAARAETRRDQTRPTAPLPRPGTRVELTLDDASQRALERNLDIAVERLNPQTFDFSLAALDANYRPTFTSNFGLRSQSYVSAQPDGGRRHARHRHADRQHGLTQNMKWGGGSFAVGVQQQPAGAVRRCSRRATRRSTPTSRAAYVQPLLRNFRIDGTRAQLQDHADQPADLRDRRCARRSRARSRTCATRTGIWSTRSRRPKSPSGRWRWRRKLVEDNQARVEVGTLAPLDVVQAQAEEATRRQAVARPRGRGGPRSSR